MNLRSNSEIHENQFDSFIRDVPPEIGRAIAAAALSSGQVFMMYVDKALPGEGFHEWLTSHFRPDFKGFTVESKAPCIPDTAAEVILEFAGVPPAEGIVDDAYLEALGRQAVPSASYTE